MSAEAPGSPGGGRQPLSDLFRPSDGIRLWARSNPQCEVDEKRERYFMTYKPRGSLQRVR